MILGKRLRILYWICRMERKSEYFTGLSAASRLRYEQKVINSGLQIDPYTTEDWLEAPEIIPSCVWSIYDSIYQMDRHDFIYDGNA